MKNLILLIIFSFTIFAQTANPEAVFLSESQIKRLSDTQQAIVLLTVQLDAAKKTQEIELLKIQLECGAVPDKYEGVSQIDGKWGFKRKAEKKAEAKP